MKNLIIILTIVCASSIVHAQKFDWAISGVGKLVDEGNAVCMDADGNSYITGNFSSNPLLFGKISLKNSSTNSAVMDMFVAKLDAKGNFLWAIQSNGTGEERGIDIACDKTGNVVVVGVFRGEKATFGTTELVNQFKFSNSTFIMRLNSQGNIQWVQRAGGKGDTAVSSVSVAPDGEIYITGTFTGGTTFGGYEYKSKSGNNPTVFVAKYLADGNLKWFEQIYGVKSGGQNSSQKGKAIFATKDSKYVYVAGWFRGKSAFGDTQIESNTEPSPSGQRPNIFITKYDSNGKGIWTKSIGEKQLNYSSDAEITDIVADEKGSVYLTGYFPGVLMFGETELRGNPSKSSWNYDIFLAKYDADGNHQWHKNAGGSGADYSHSMALTSNGVLITGQVVGTNIKFGNVPLADTQVNAFTANYDADGKCLWAIQSKRLILAKGNGIATNGTNTVITGMFLGRVLEIFGETPLKGTGAGNFFATSIK
ncbi:MAG TPA: hypothetical protein PKE69_04525 [Pyrinomonadaceae bacterium]|nr:hypothetical protein [Pyrinomonadaceae bacterium]